jgi:hypothetical protein
MQESALGPGAEIAGMQDTHQRSVIGRRLSVIGTRISCQA